MAGMGTLLGRMLTRRHSLLFRGWALFVALLGLLSAEFVLGLMFVGTMDEHQSELRRLDRRAQTMLVAAGKMSDFLFDVNHELDIGEPLHASLAHWHTHLIAMTVVEGEMRRQGRPVPEPSLGDLMQRSSELQLAPDQAGIQRYVEQLREAVNLFSQEALHLLVEVDTARRQHAEAMEKSRQVYVTVMLGIGLGGTLLVVWCSGVFLSNLVRSLRAIAAKARAIRDGSLGGELISDRTDEVGEVVEAINATTRSLADSGRQIEELRLRLGHHEKLQALGTFASGMAHEIGNPIQAISALCYQVSDSLTSDHGIENIQANILLVDSIAAHADRLSRTISEIREFAHPAKPEMEAVDVNEVVKATVALMRFDPRFKRTQLVAEYGAGNPVIQAVHDHLVQVIVNLLTNAADALPEQGGVITVRTTDAESGVVITVADNGSGMPEHVLAHACEAFFTTKPRSRGTGMGLSICRSIIDAHKGAMDIVSKHGAGTTIVLTLPRGQV